MTEQTDWELFIEHLPHMIAAALVIYPFLVALRYIVIGALEIIKMIGGLI